MHSIVLVTIDITVTQLPSLFDISVAMCLARINSCISSFVSSENCFHKYNYTCTSVEGAPLLGKFIEVCFSLERFCKNQLIVCHNRTVKTKN